MSILKILIIVTGTGAYAGRNLATGLWLSEFTHIYRRAREAGYEITIANPNGGNVPVDPESLKPVVLDKMSKEYWNDPGFRDMLHHVKSLDDVLGQSFDCIYLAGGHGTLYDFPDNAVLQSIIKDQYESDKIVAAICHGVSGLSNVKLSSGEYLIKDKVMTGFSWFEETLANRKEEVPFNLEALLKERGADYKKAWIPMTSNVIVDKNLITGQNPFSSKEMAEVVLRQLNKNVITNK